MSGNIFDTAKACAELDALFDRLEHTLTRPGPEYGIVENAADVEQVKRFQVLHWGNLSHAQQRHYRQRIAHLKVLSRRRAGSG